MSQLSDLVASYQDEMIKMLQNLVRIPSVKGEKDGPYPFGKPIDDCLRLALAYSRDFGLEPTYVDGYCGHANIGQGEKTLGILVHLDVVPAGEGWTLPPFGATLLDGKLYGRGANDNKAATVATLFALRALREAGIPFTKKVRVIFGCDEESGWDDIAYYKTKYAMPDFGFSPDACFPVINAEKGITHLELSVPLSGDDLRLKNVFGGERANVVCARCEAELDGIYPLEPDGAPVQITEKDGRTHLVATGVAAHGSRPETGVNAAIRLMQMLRKNGWRGGAIDFVCDLLGDDTSGSSMGVGLRDDPSGLLSLNLGTVRLENGCLRLVIDIRYPVTCTFDQVLSALQAKVSPLGVSIRVLSQKDPLFLPEDHALVKTLTDIYAKITGEYIPPQSMGGGTYARALDNAVAFGMNFPGVSEEEHGVHTLNEYIGVDELVRATQIFAHAIAALQEVDL